MYPILFKIGGLTIYTHGVLAVFGIVFGSYILYKLAQGEKLDSTVLFDNIVYSVLVGIIGARLTYFFLYREQFDSFSQIFYLWQGGMVSYGGFIPGFLTFTALLRLQKVRVNNWLALAAIAFPAGLFWGRIGNLFAGEYAGVSSANKISLGGKVPVTLLEAGLLLIITIALYLLYKNANKVIKEYLFFLFGILYSSGRFIIDFWRDEAKIFLNLSIGQITSLLILVIFVFLVTQRFIRERRAYQVI